AAATRRPAVAEAPGTAEVERGDVRRAPGQNPQRHAQPYQPRPRCRTRVVPAVDGDHIHTAATDVLRHLEDVAPRLRNADVPVHARLAEYLVQGGKDRLLLPRCRVDDHVHILVGPVCFAHTASCLDYGDWARACQCPPRLPSSAVWDYS